MNLHSNPETKEDLERRKRMINVALALFGFIVLCIFALYAFEYFPRYVTLPIKLPQDDFSSGIWNTTSYTIDISNWDFGRVFTWRRGGTVVYLNAGNSDKMITIRDYFKSEVNKLGWVRGDDTEICNNYMPEAYLLVEKGSGDILQFQQKGQPVYSTGDYYGDLVCVSILKIDSSLNDQNQDFNITLLTARQSPLRIFFNWIGNLLS
jgi:hypothetical protein